MRRFRVETCSGELVEVMIWEENGVFKAKFSGDDREYVIRIISFDEELKQAVLEINGRRVKVSGVESGIVVNGIPAIVKRIIELIPTGLSTTSVERKRVARSHIPGVIVAPIAGRIVDVKVKSGDKVVEDTVVALLESMKMITEVKAGVKGVVEEVYVEKGKTVNKGDRIVKIKTK